MVNDLFINHTKTCSLPGIPANTKKDTSSIKREVSKHLILGTSIIFYGEFCHFISRSTPKGKLLFFSMCNFVVELGSLERLSIISFNSLCIE